MILVFDGSRQFQLRIAAPVGFAACRQAIRAVAELILQSNNPAGGGRRGPPKGSDSFTRRAL